MSCITVPQAIRNAIETETAAANFYRSLVPRARDADTARLLIGMVRDEEAHAQQLTAVVDALSVGPLPDAADELAHLVESSPPLSSSNISFVKALFLALDAEHHAAHFYSVVAEATSGDVRDLFLRLAAVERGHARRIEQMLDTRTA